MCTVAVVWGGIPWSPLCRMLNIYVLIGCWLNKRCTVVQIETHAFRETGNSAAAIFAPSTCPALELHSMLHARCVPRHVPQLWSGSTAVIVCLLIPMLSVLGIRRKGRCGGWLIEIVAVHCTALFIVCWCAFCLQDHMNHANTNLESLASVHWPTYYEVSADVWSMCHRRQLCPDFLPVGRETWVSACMDWLCSTPFNRRFLNVFGKSPLTTWSAIQIVSLRCTS